MNKVKEFTKRLVGHLTGTPKKAIGVAVGAMLLATSWLHMSGRLDPLWDFFRPNTEEVHAEQTLPDVPTPVPGPFEDTGVGQPVEPAPAKPKCPPGTVDIFGQEGKVVGCFLSPEDGAGEGS